MTPALAFLLAVLISEGMQLGTWKLGNPDKPWGKWFSWGIPHFLSNLGIVVAVFLAWQGQVLDDALAWCLSWVGYDAKFQWDQLLIYNVVTGFVLGLATDFFADKFGYAAKLLLPKLGAIAEAFKPKSGKETP
jgi:hypothetical protein